MADRRVGDRRRGALAIESASKRARAWVDVEQEVRFAIEYGVSPRELGEAIAHVLRSRGLESSAYRVSSAARRAEE